MIYLRPPLVENDPEAIIEQNGDQNGDIIDNEEETMLPKEVPKIAWVIFKKIFIHFFKNRPK